MWRRYFPILIIILLLTGCGGNKEDDIVIPTRYQSPTPLPTDTPTATNTPTDTMTPTNTVTATNTPTATFTYTPTVTASPTASSTTTDTPTPTATSTFTITPSPTATFTVTPTATPDTPQVTSFSSDFTTAPGDSSITLTWTSINAFNALLERLNQQGMVQDSVSVVPNGQLPVILPNVSEQVIYRLTVYKDDGSKDTRSIVIHVTKTCSIPWFFGTENAPETSGCPIAEAISITGKIQLFDRGIMFNAPFGAENRVYGLTLVNGQRNYIVYLNEWDGTTVHTSSCGTAPAGKVEPQDVFNWMYHAKLSPNGQWCNANTGIGWATQAANTSMGFIIQYESSGTAFFLGIPNYGTIRISGEAGVPAVTGSVGTWQFIVAP